LTATSTMCAWHQTDRGARAARCRHRCGESRSLYHRSTRGRSSPCLARSTQGLERPGTLVSILGLMRLTAEIRWFWPDRPPQEFHAWFVGAGAAWGRPARAKHVSTSTFAIRTKIPLASRRVAAATSRSRGCQPLNLPAAHRQSTLGQVGIAHAGWPAARRKAAPDAKLLDPCRLRLRACDFERAGLWRCSFRNDCPRLKRIVATMRGTGSARCDACSEQDGANQTARCVASEKIGLFACDFP
jgi:hypothetical protein